MTDGTIEVLVYGAACVALYLLPTVAAYRRQHRNREAIAFLNIALGWTVLGWIIAAVWALAVPMPKETARDEAPERPAPAARGRRRPGMPHGTIIGG